MRTKSLLILILVGLFLVSSYHQRGVEVTAAMRPDGSDTSAPGFDIVQRTCALEVVLAVRDIEALPSADPSPEPIPVHWDARPGNTVLACLPAPAK